MTRRLLVLVFSLSVALLATTSAGAAPASITIESRSPELVEKDDGSWTTSLAFTNVTDGEIELSATATGCQPTLDKSAKLPPRERTKVTVTIPATCVIGESGFTFVIAARAADRVSVGTFDVTAGPKPEEDVDWSPLGAFFVTFAAALLLAIVVYLTWHVYDKQTHSPFERLQYLEDDWSFKDSWATNVTAAAALLTGIFGSAEVVTALLGEDADRAVALATVGVAIAAAFVAAGPIVLATLKRQGDVMVCGFLGALVFTMGGAAGELWVVYESGRKLDLGGWEDKLYLPVIGAAVLLVLYTVVTGYATLEAGTTPPPPDDGDFAHDIMRREVASDVRLPPPRRRRRSALL